MPHFADVFDPAPSTATYLCPGRRRPAGVAARIAALAAVATLVAGCGRTLLPTEPSPTPWTTPITPPPQDPPAPSPSRLKIVSFNVNLGSVHEGTYWYLPEIVLGETSGASPVFLKRFEFRLSYGDRFIFDDSAPLGRGCLLTQESRTVPAGGRWTSEAVYRYCLPIDSGPDLQGTTVALTVTFADEHGVTAEVSGSAVVGAAH